MQPSPVDVSETRRLLVAAGVTRRIELRHCEQTGSTNVDLRTATTTGSDWVVLTTEEQVAGRGRAGRTWSCPPGQGLMVSIRLQPAMDPRWWSWVGVVVGLSVRAALADHVVVELKWPNDLQIAGDKLGGILAEATGDGSVIVGFGLNVTVAPSDLPRSDATSLLAAGVTIDRAALLAAILRELDQRLQRWEGSAGDIDAAGLRAEYLLACVTLGRQVRAELPDGTAVIGRAIEVDAGGALVVETAEGTRSLSAADVHHLRPIASEAPPVE